MKTIFAAAVLVALEIGAPGPTFVERFPGPQEQMRLHNRSEFWHLRPIPRQIDPPGEHYRMGKGELMGHCHLVSEIGIKCRWLWARV